MDLKVLSINLPENIEREIILGNISNAEHLINIYLKRNDDDLLRKRLEIELERLKRMDKSFPLKRKDLIKIFKANIKNFDTFEIEDLIKNGYIERRIINGEERFLEKTLDNVFFLNSEYKKRKINIEEKKDSILDTRIKKIMEGDIATYRITAGIEITLEKESPYHVWLPIPTENGTISNVKILKTFPEKYRISEKSLQKTVYFYDTEKRFNVEFSYEISERKLSKTESKRNELFLDEKYPHVVFNEHIKNITEEIIAGENSDFRKAFKIYKWITENIYYSYVPPYLFFNNISEYALTNRKGDCGFMALLFITMARTAGIPAKWQSGWYITPEKATPHDWAEVYLDGYGFVPVDPSFGNVLKGNAKYRDFYFGNQDAFRMIANDDFQVQFDPEKKYIRSDPVDNQVGEVETESGNVSNFSSKIYVKHFERIH